MDDVLSLERELVTLAEAWTRPLPRECLDCYLQRMLTEHGCAGEHRFTRRWARDRPRGTEDGLVRWAAQRGGCCCDCEVVMNSLHRTRSAVRRAGVLCDAALQRRSLGDDEPEPAGGCSGVR